MNIRSQSVGPAGLHIVASDGREVRITAATVMELFNGNEIVDPEKTLQENIQQAKDAVRLILGERIVEQLGREQVSTEMLSIDFNEANGSITELRWEIPDVR